MERRSRGLWSEQSGLWRRGVSVYLLKIGRREEEGGEEKRRTHFHNL
jgi:hypothetical protein